jgi:hypothetical protein
VKNSRRPETVLEGHETLTALATDGHTYEAHGVFAMTLVEANPAEPEKKLPRIPKMTPETFLELVGLGKLPKWLIEDWEKSNPGVNIVKLAKDCISKKQFHTRRSIIYLFLVIPFGAIIAFGFSWAKPYGPGTPGGIAYMIVSVLGFFGVVFSLMKAQSNWLDSINGSWYHFASNESWPGADIRSLSFLARLGRFIGIDDSKEMIRTKTCEALQENINALVRAEHRARKESNYDDTEVRASFHKTLGLRRRFGFNEKWDPLFAKAEEIVKAEEAAAANQV